MRRKIRNFGGSVVIVICAVLMAAFSWNTNEASSIDLQSAISQGKVKAELRSLGGYHDACVQLKVFNNTGGTLRVKIPAGTLFNPEDEGEQTLVAPEDQLIVLQPRAQLVQDVSAFCSQASERCPTEGSSFTLGLNKNASLTKLLTQFNTLKPSEESYQDAIWAVTDGHSISNIPNTTQADKELRKFLCTLTGRSDVWYSTPQERRVADDGTIQHETVTVRGNISYTAKKGAQIYNEIIGHDGSSVHKTEANSAPFNGKVEFTFTIRVKGWKKGDYFVKVKEGDTEIASYPFTI